MPEPEAAPLPEVTLGDSTAPARASNASASTARTNTAPEGDAHGSTTRESTAHANTAQTLTTPTTNYLPQPLQLDPICLAALRCFTVNGFHGTSIRQIAAEANLSVAGLYHHYESKDAILVRICEFAMTELLAASRRAIASRDTTAGQFEQLVTCLVQFHAVHGEVAFVAYSEIRSLPPAARERHLQARRDEQALVTELVERGASEGVFATAHPREAARAVTSICFAVSQWYRPGGTMGVDELVSVYLDIVRDTVVTTT